MTYIRLIVFRILPIAALLIFAANIEIDSQEASASVPLKAGGLVSLPERQRVPVTIGNPGFEILGSNGDPQGWTDNGLVSDATIAHTGSRSYRLTDAHLIPNAQSALHKFSSLKKGIYTIGGWVKLSGMAATKGNGVRLCLNGSQHPWTLGRACTDYIKGTSDWQYIEKKNILVTGDSTTASFNLESYGETDGTAWFDDVVLYEQAPFPVEVFMLYPNYRGMLFDDQPQTLRLQVNLPSASANSSVLFQVVDEATNTIVKQQIYSSQGQTSSVATIEVPMLEVGKSYLVKSRLTSATGFPGIAFEYAPYRIVKVAGSERATMTTSFDEHGRFLFNGQPTFLLGLYDSGLGYYSTETGWENALTNDRKLFELPGNMYINYWYGATPSSSLNLLMNVLDRHDMKYLQTGNCFNTGYNESQFKINTSDAYLQDIAGHNGLAGYYVMDECISDLVPKIFNQYQRLKSFDPDSVTFSASMIPNELFFWRDSVDIISTDPYPLYGAEPAGGYPLKQVADWVKASKDAVYGARPIAAVLQYFQSTSNARWPTKDELRNMSYMSIAEGANGVFYWSLGTRALAYVCTGWCDQKIEYFNRLKDVMNELKELEPALIAIDNQTFLSSTGNSNIKARVKEVNGTYYIIAYNYSNQPVTTTFTVNQATDIVVFKENRTITPLGNQFSDTFGAYQAHVYVVTP